VLVYDRVLSDTEISDIYLNYRQDRILFQWQFVILFSLAHCLIMGVGLDSIKNNQYY
jgi:hypothetical protein